MRIRDGELERRLKGKKGKQNSGWNVEVVDDDSDDECDVSAEEVLLERAKSGEVNEKAGKEQQ